VTKNPPLEELYDLTNDPLESHNLANSPTERTRLAQLRERLAELKKNAK
jgi:arylsulfatase A-like enzyme